MLPKHLRPGLLKYFLVIDGNYPWVGFVLTIIVLAVLIYLQDVLALTLSFSFVFVVLSVYVGGIWWGLASAAAVIATGAFLMLPTGQYVRFIAISTTVLTIVYLVTILQRKAVICESINGNISALLKIMVSLQDVLDDWDRLNRSEIKNDLKRATDGIVDLTTKVKGWHEIRMEMEIVNRAHPGDRDE